MCGRLNVLLVLTLVVAGMNFAMADGTASDDVAKLKSLYAQRLQEIQQVSDTARVNILGKYRKYLMAFRQGVKQKGDLDAVQAVDKEINRYDLHEILPSEADAPSYAELAKAVSCFRAEIDKVVLEQQRKRAQLAGQYAKLLDQRVKLAVQKDKLDDARIYKEELDSVKETPDYKAVQQMPPEPPPQQQSVSKTAPASYETKKSATLYITCDNEYKVWINGKLIGSDDRWETLESYDITIANNDIIAIEAMDHDSGNKSAALYCCIVLDDDKKSWGIDRDWHVTVKMPEKGWQSAKLTKFSDRLSDSNIHYSHTHRVAEYQKSKPFLQGSFVWSKNPSKTIYVKETILFSNFSSVRN
jgi:hypothetical protein